MHYAPHPHLPQSVCFILSFHQYQRLSYVEKEKTKLLNKYIYNRKVNDFKTDCNKVPQCIKASDQGIGR